MGRSGDSSRTFRLDIAPAAAPDAQPRRVAPDAQPRRVAPDAPPAHIPIPVEASNYERLLDSVYDAVLLATRDGVIQECNTRAVDFLAIPADSIRGARLRDFISGADSTLMESVWSNACRHRHTLIEAHCVRADGSMFPAEIAVSRVDMGEGRDLCFFIRDVTLRRQAEDSRERAMARLEEQDQVRSQFVANVSHELRTPLTSMIYAVGNLLRGVAGTLPERVREYVEMLDGDCKRLLSTVTDILDLRQIDRQSLTLTRTRVPLAPLVLKAVEALRVQARQKRVSLELDPGVRWWFVDCDVAKMERVVINLVGNAIKFTPEHGLIDMAVELDPQRTGYVLFSVKDSGIGIPPNEIDKVTQRYYTVGPQPVGAGLGLAIAREIVDLHGGSLQIESPVPGRTCGTAVRVSLPLVEPAQLLVVSANAAIRDRVEDEFSIHGYRVRAAADTTKAATCLDEGGVDAVLVDFCDAEDSVRDLLLRMRSQKTTLRVPVVALTPPIVSGPTAAILRSFSIPALPARSAMTELMDLVGGVFFDRSGAGRTAVLHIEHPYRPQSKPPPATP